MNTPALLPCPFCGAQAVINRFNKRIAVNCVNEDCKAQQKGPKEDEAKLIAAWNARAPSKESRRFLQRIKFTALTAMNAPAGLTHIIRLCIDAGITEKLDALRAIADEERTKPDNHNANA